MIRRKANRCWSFVLGNLLGCWIWWEIMSSTSLQNELRRTWYYHIARIGVKWYLLENTSHIIQTKPILKSLPTMHHKSMKYRKLTGLKFILHHTSIWKTKYFCSVIYFYIKCIYPLCQEDRQILHISINNTPIKFFTSYMKHWLHTIVYSEVWNGQELW